MTKEVKLDIEKVKKVDYEKYDEEVAKKVDGLIVELEGKKYVVKDEVVAQVAGEPVKEVVAHRLPDENTVHISGEEFENNLTNDCEDFVGALLYGSDEDGIDGFYDYLERFKLTLQQYEGNRKKSVAKYILNNFFDVKDERLISFFLDYADGKDVDFKYGERVYLESALKKAELRKELLDQEFISAQIDLRTYQNAKELIEYSVTMIKKYLSLYKGE